MAGREDLHIAVRSIDRHTAKFRVDDPDLLHTGFEKNTDVVGGVIVSIGTRKNFNCYDGRPIKLISDTSRRHMFGPNEQAGIQSDNSFWFCCQTTACFTSGNDADNFRMALKPRNQRISNPHHRGRMSGISRRHVSPPFDDFTIDEGETSSLRRFGFRAEEIIQGGGFRDDGGHVRPQGADHTAEKNLRGVGSQRSLLLIRPQIRSVFLGFRAEVA